MTRDQLHAIAVRRKGDSIVKVLLLEIKRLRGVVVEAHKRAASLPLYNDDPNVAYLIKQLVEVFEDEPAIVESSGKLTRAKSDREVKRQARMRRG